MCIGRAFLTNIGKMMPTDTSNAKSGVLNRYLKHRKPIGAPIYRYLCCKVESASRTDTSNTVNRYAPRKTDTSFHINCVPNRHFLKTGPTSHVSNFKCEPIPNWRTEPRIGPKPASLVSQTGGLASDTDTSKPRVTNRHFGVLDRYLKHRKPIGAPICRYLGAPKRGVPQETAMNII